jgi:hypothetical protein
MRDIVDEERRGSDTATHATECHEFATHYTRVAAPPRPPVAARGRAALHTIYHANISRHAATRRPCQVGPSRTYLHSGFFLGSRRALQTAWNVGTSASVHSK